MRIGTYGLLLIALFASLMFSMDSEAVYQKLLNRSIYVPVSFVVCEHLGSAVYYEHDQLVSTVPVSRIFQFTYYPNLKKMLPAAVNVRVEGQYRDTAEPFVARVAVTPEGFVTADARRPFDIEKNLRKLRYKLDVRQQRIALKLACDRFCSRRTNDPTARLSDESTESNSKPTDDDQSPSRD